MKTNFLIKAIVIMLLTITGTFAQDPVLKKSALVSSSQGGGTASVYTTVNGFFMDKEGNRYMAGRYNGLYDFDPGPGVVQPPYDTNIDDIYVSKLDKNNNLLWVKFIGTSQGEEYVSNMTVDENQNVIVAGTFRNDTDFDPGPGVFTMSNGTVPNTFKSLFILKLDANGNFIWAKNFQAENSVGMSFSIGDMNTDAQNNILLSGYYSGSVDFDPNSGTAISYNPSGDIDAFFLKMNASGSYVFYKKFGPTFFYDNADRSINDEFGRSSVADAAGNVYYLWTFRNGNSIQHTVLHKYSPTGTQLWEYRITLPASTSPTYLKTALDKLGNVFISSDKTVIKINASTGAEIWNKPIRGFNISIDKNNNIIKTGGLNSQDDFDPGSGTYLLSSVGTNDGLLSKMDNDGNFIYAKGLGAVGSASQVVRQNFTSYGDIQLWGYFSTNIDVDPSAATKTLTNSSGSAYQGFWATYSLPCTGAVNSSSSSVTACSSYRWATNGITYTTSGIYKDTLTNVAGCDSVITLNLTINPFSGITATTVNGYTLTCTNPSTTVTASGLSGAYSWTGPNGYTANTAAATFTVAGTYWVTGTATGGCIVSKSVDIFEDKIKPTLAASPTTATIFCATPTAYIQLSGSATIFSWTGPNGFTANTPFANLKTGGVFTAVGTGANGCTNSGTVNVTITDSRVVIPITVTPATAIRNCTNLNPTVTASGATTYLWTRSSDGFTASTPSVTISNLDTYTVTGNSASGCGSVSVPLINDAFPPTVTISPSSAILTCTNPTATLTASGGSTYSWTGPSGFTSSTSTAIVANTGYFTVIVTGSNGCSANNTILISQDKTAPSVVISTTSGSLTCTNPTATLTATNITGTYSWTRSGGGFTATSAVVSVSLAGTYIVTATGTNGCTATASIAITEDKILPITVSSGSGILTCTNQSLSVTASGGNSYSWTGPVSFTSSVASINITSVGTYTVTGTGINGCTATANVVVTENKILPTVSITPTPAFLTCTNLRANLTASGGNSYYWTKVGGGYSNTGATVSIDVVGIYSVLGVNNTNGCTATSTVAIIEDKTPPVISITPTSVVLTCANPTANLTASGGVSYVWTRSGGGFTATTPSINVTTPDLYFATGTGANGCTSLGSINVTQNIAAPSTGLTYTTTVLTCTNPSIPVTASGGDSYAWTGTGGFTATTAIVNISTIGTYVVTITGSNGCTATRSVAITQNTVILIAITPTSAVLTCANPTRTLTASGGNTYSWTGTGGFTASTASATISSAGTYIVTAIGANGCTGSASVVITQNITVPTVSITPATATITCANPNTTLTASGGSSYSWTGPSGFTATTASATIAAGGTYFVTATGSNGCTATASTTIIDNKVLVVTLGPHNPVLNCNFPSRTITAMGGVSYSWTGPSGFTASTSAVNLTIPGTYTVTANDGSGCFGSTSVVITEDKTPPVTTITATRTSLTCTNPSATLTASSGSTYYWAAPQAYGFTQQSINTTLAGAGTYTLYLTGANGCTGSASVVIVNNVIAPPVVISPSSASLTCTNPTTTLTASGGGTFAWTSTNTFTSTMASVTISVAGTYTVTATGTNGCSANASASVTNNTAAPGASISPVNAILNCTNPTTTLTAAGGNSYTWTGPNGFTASTTAITASSGGVYTITSFGTNGCTATASVNVTNNKTTPTVTIIPTSPTDAIMTCNLPRVVMEANATSAANPVTYNWIGPNGFVRTGSFPTPVPQAAGLYTVTATDNNGCTSTASITVIDGRTPPVFNVTPTSAILTCTNPTATLTASGASTYEWTKTTGGFNSSLASITISTIGTYRVVATGANGCTAATNVTVTLDKDPPVVNIGGSSVLNCSFPIKTLTGFGADSYSWSDVGGFISTTTSIDVSVAGTYFVIGTSSANGCTAARNIVVTENKTPPTIIATPTSASLTCANPSTTITATLSFNGSSNFLWTGPGGFTATTSSLNASSSLTISTAGTYTVRGTPGINGCTASVSFAVIDDKAPPLISVTPTSTVLTCANPSTTLTASGGNSYSWTGTGGFTATTASATIATAGTYVVTATGTNNCTASTSVVVTENKAAPIISVTPTSAILTCTNPTTTLTASGGNSYSWTGTGGFTATTASATIANAGTYIVTATGTNNCTALTSVVITENKVAPTVSVTPTSAVLTCTNPSTNITANGGNSYSWTGTGGFTANTASATITTAGTYVVTATGTNNCTASRSVVITENKVAPTVSVTPTSAILTCTNPSTNITANGGNSYSWTGTGGFTANIASVTISSAGTYIVTATGSNGCTASTSVVITESKAVPTVLVTPTNAILDCNNSSVVLAASGGSTYSWTGTGGFTANTASVSITTAGTYIVTSTGTNGCINSASKTVTENTTPPTIVVTPTSTVLNCANPSLTLTVSGGATYKWYFSGILISSSATINVSSPATYLVTTTGANGCTNFRNVTVTENITPPTITVTPTSAILTCANPSTTITASGGSSYAWTGTGGFTATTASATISSAGTYTVTGTSANGCTASVGVAITENKVAPTVSVTPTTAILTCANPTTTLTASGGNSYAWTGTGGFTATTNSVTITAAGTYTVTGTGTNGCTASASVVITDNIGTTPTAPTISPTGTITLCPPSTSLTLTASGCAGGTITWNTSPASTGTSIIVTQVGSYSATCTTACGTSPASATATISTVCACLLNTSLATGNWSTPNNWSCGHVPLVTEPVQISTGHTVTLDVNGTAKSLDLRGILNKQATKILNIQGN